MKHTNLKTISKCPRTVPRMTKVASVSTTALQSHGSVNDRHLCRQDFLPGHQNSSPGWRRTIEHNQLLLVYNQALLTYHCLNKGNQFPCKSRDPDSALVYIDIYIDSRSLSRQIAFST